MVTLEQIRNNIQAAIRNSGIKQIELARRLGIHHSAIAQYLSGRAMPALDTFANLCAVLDLDPSEILCLKDNGGALYHNDFRNNNGTIINSFKQGK